MGSSAYIQVPRSSNYTYVAINIDSINGNSPTITSTGSYALNFSTPIASSADIYVRFSSRYYPINISGYVA